MNVSRSHSDSLYNNTKGLLTEREVFTEKYRTEVSTVRTEAVGRGPYIRDRGPIFFRTDRANEVNNTFII